MMGKWLMAIGVLIVAVSAKADEALLEVKQGDVIETLYRADISAMPTTAASTHITSAVGCTRRSPTT